MSDSTWGDSVNLQLAQKEALLFEFQDFGFQIYQNIFEQIKNIHKMKQGAFLQGAFAGIPAIILGAGPSLASFEPHMKGAKEKALIFAGGTALSELAKWKMSPHFAAAVDPIPEMSAKKWHFDCPIFFQGRTHAGFFENGKGEYLHTPSSGVHPFENHLYGQLASKELESLDSGWTVSTYLATLASFLGCSPIIFVGMDLCYSSGKKYSTMEAKKLPQDKLISLKDIDGNIVITQRDWILAASWLESWIQNLADTPCINTSLQGKKLQGAKMMSVQEALDMLSPIGRSLEALVQEKVTDLPGFSSIVSWEKIKEEIHKAKKIISQMLALVEKHFPEPVWQKGEFILLESDLYDSFTYSMFLEPSWNAWSTTFEPMYKAEADPLFAKRVHQLLFFQNIVENHPYGK